ncbi:MAG: hypothetical protein INQ03_17835 [Candidatus Heimdallarchaeota archaeon]|nr:hypothetical protein [Candidatus Heimdallarchaeota archaeon]
MSAKEKKTFDIEEINPPLPRYYNVQPWQLILIFFSIIIIFIIYLAITRQMMFEPGPR